MQFCSVLCSIIEELETWSESEDKFVNDSFIFVMISDGDFMHFCSILLFAIVKFETWPVTEDNLVDDTLTIVVISEGNVSCNFVQYYFC